jgi:VanZ family protein
LSTRPWITTAAQAALAVGLLASGALMLGPFQDAERLVLLTDKEAHVIAFFALCLLAFLAAPRLRKDDLTLAALALAAASELAQAFVGRTAGFDDLLADAIGIALAWAPMQVAQVRMRMTLRRRALDAGFPPPLARRVGEARLSSKTAPSPPA